MLYQKSLTVPADTPEDKPVEVKITVKHPVIRRLGVHFPPGCHLMVKVAVFYGKYQIFPAKEGDWCSGDNTTVWDEFYFEVPEKETDLTLKGCSPKTDYKHTITFYIIATPREVPVYAAGLGRLIKLFERLLRIFGVRV